MKNAFQNVRVQKKTETVAPVVHEQPVVEVKREPKKDKWGRAYATGRRKESSARVWIKPRAGATAVFTVNGREVNTYLARKVLQMIVNQPFAATKTEGQFDVLCTVKGGGLSGQAGAIRHGISRALDNFDPVAFHSILRKGGFLTRGDRKSVV